MDKFQQQTAALFTRQWIANAVDRGDMDEAMAMSRRLDEITLRLLREEKELPLTATGGRA